MTPSRLYYFLLSWQSFLQPRQKALHLGWVSKIEMRLRAAHSSNFHRNVVCQDGEGRLVGGIVTDTNRESFFGQSSEQGANRAPFSLDFGGNHFPHFVSAHHSKN